MIILVPTLLLIGKTNEAHVRIVEEEIESAIESRNEALQTIRELGPPDLVHLVKQSKSSGRQVEIERKQYRFSSLADVL